MDEETRGKLNEKSLEEIRYTLDNLQDIVVSAIDEVKDIGYDIEEFHQHLDAYELLVREAEQCLVQKYLKAEEIANARYANRKTKAGN